MIDTTTGLMLMLLKGPSWGLQLIETARGVSGVRLRQGTVYPALEEMEALGWVKGSEERCPGRGRPRRVFELTAKGRLEAERRRSALLRLAS